MHCGSGRLAQALATLKKCITSLFLFVNAVFFQAAPVAFAQSTVPFVLSVVSGDAQTTALNQVFPQRLVVRLTDSSANPIKGAPVNFQNSPCLTILGSPCEFPGAPGHFESGSYNATVVTDASGIAVAPPYYAGGDLGSPNWGINPGGIGLEVIVIPDAPPYFFTIPQAVSNFAVFNLREVAAPTIATTPAFSLPSLLLLCILLVFVGSVVLNGRCSR